METLKTHAAGLADLWRDMDAAEKAAHVAALAAVLPAFYVALYVLARW